MALDSNIIVADEAIEDIESETPQTTSTPAKTDGLRLLSLFVLALIGATLIILLQFSIISQNESERGILEDHANQTFELYQQQLDEAEADASTIF